MMIIGTGIAIADRLAFTLMLTEAAEADFYRLALFFFFDSCSFQRLIASSVLLS